jgi:hypothetical protein
VKSRLADIAVDREPRNHEFVALLDPIERQGVLSAFKLDNGHLMLAEAVRKAAVAEQAPLESLAGISGDKRQIGNLA